MHISLNNQSFHEIKMEMLRYIQQWVDMGTADGVELSDDGESARVIYDMSERWIIAHVAGIASLMREGIYLENGGILEVISAEIPRHFEDANRALRGAGVRVTHAKVKCLLETETAMITIVDGNFLSFGYVFSKSVFD